jgi:hypothetical protein
MITQARHSGSRYITADINDPSAYDEDGILKDGYRIRVPVEMMDSTLPLQRIGTVPRNIVTGLNMQRFYFPDGESKADFAARIAPRQPARRVQRDQQEHQAEDATVTEAYASHKPGYRVADATVTQDAGQALKDAAYEEMVRDNENAWKSPEQMVADARQVTTDAACPAGIDPRDWAYHQRCQQDSEAWRTPAPVFDAAAVENPPAGAYCKAGVGAREGDIVTWNGAPARLEKRGDWLFPVVHQQGPTRSGTSNGDVAVVDRAAQDNAYREYCDRISNEWRS